MKGRSMMRNTMNPEFQENENAASSTNSQNYEAMCEVEDQSQIHS
jgi:hypothetical protein